MEPHDDIAIFKALLRSVGNQFWKNGNTASTIEMNGWKGHEITNFQDDLRSNTGSTVSEKWFYTYVKNNPEKLPRIDILNLLAQYIGENNWYAFAKAEKNRIIDFNNYTKKAETLKTKQKDKESIQSKSKKTYWKAMISLTVSVIFMIYSLMNKETKYEFCFVDNYSKIPIENIALDIHVLHKNESPQYFKTDSLGCFKGTTSGSLIKFVVSSPYYKNDTITRVLNGEQFEQLPLRTDDYALMLDYYSNGKVEEFKKRKAQLNQLIARDAIIMEVLPHSIGVTLYEKADFINKLTTPTSTLKRLEIIETTYGNDQITKLKFRIQR